MHPEVQGGHIRMPSKFWCALTVMVLGMMGCGTGEEGPARYPVSGSVTYDGQPVPRGTVAFEPDSSKGNNGPAVVAPIQDGRYETASGAGTVGGPHLVRIEGFDGQPTTLPDGMAMPDGKKLFPDFSTTAELPNEAATQDFDVPVSTPK